MIRASGERSLEDVMRAAHEQGVHDFVHGVSWRTRVERYTDPDVRRAYVVGYTDAEGAAEAA